MKARIIALYLPQFHPIPENDEWWGKGFTEWTNVRKAAPLFKGHAQPRVPTDLGYYSLLDPDVREKQASLARASGVEAFCYYHYWFGGKRLLERPFDEVVASGRPDFPFCLCWANHTWSNKTWQHSSLMHKDSVLMEQTYPGLEDHTAHFYSLLPAFRDRRYVKVDGKLLFSVYSVFDFPGIGEFLSTWRRLAEENGLPGFHFVGICPSTYTVSIADDGSRRRTLPDLKSSKALFERVLSYGFDAVNSFGKRRGELLYDGKLVYYAKVMLKKLELARGGMRYDYSRVVRNYFAPEDSWENVYPTILPQWDRTPRVASADGIYVNVSPEKFRRHICQALDIVASKAPEHRIIFLKSWNEWGEGNYVEPDALFGRGLLDAMAAAVRGDE